MKLNLTHWMNNLLLLIDNFNLLQAFGLKLDVLNKNNIIILCC